MDSGADKTKALSARAGILEGTDEDRFVTHVAHLVLDSGQNEAGTQGSGKWSDTLRG